MNHSFTYELHHDTVIVSGTYYKGSSGSYEEAPELPSFEIESIEYKGIDIMSVVSESDQYKIEEYGKETY